MRKTYIVIWALIMTVTAFAQPEGMRPLHVDGNQLVDDEGQVHVLHGVMDTPSPYFNNYRWGNVCNTSTVGACREYCNNLFTAITDNGQGAYCNLFRLHLDPCWTNDPNLPSDGKESGEADISRFSEQRLTTLMSTLYFPIARSAINKGLYVIMRPPGVCPQNLRVGDYYQDYLVKVWDIVTKNANVRKDSYSGYLSIELANEPVNVANADGSVTDNTLRDYFQPVVDKIRENGFKGIIWVPGSGWQSNYRSYANMPVIDPLDNFGYAVHDYPGWYSSSDDNPNYQYVCAKFKESVPVVMDKPIVITEVDWSPEVEGKGHYNEHGDWVPGNMGTWATATTSLWGRGFKAMKDYFGNISMTLSGTSCYIDIDTYIREGRVVPAFNGDSEACAKACFEWYADYASRLPIIQDGLKELASPVETLVMTPGEKAKLTVDFVCNNGSRWDVALLCRNAVMNTNIARISGDSISALKEGKTELRFSLTDKNGTTKMLKLPLTVTSTDAIHGVSDGSPSTVSVSEFAIDGRKRTASGTGLTIRIEKKEDGTYRIIKKYSKFAKE